ncbi:endonuclease domain-containing 1 protein-like, partial [Arapaima gigas]
FLFLQLDGASDKEMGSDQIKGSVQRKQAVNDNYERQKTYDRRHLFPVQHCHDQDTADSTFTLTNAVPQQETFNRGVWCRMEMTVIDLVEDNCEANSTYIVTGVVPGTTKLKNLVNIHVLMWTAFCCEDKKYRKMVSQAHYGNNSNEKVVNPVSLEKLEKHLKDHYNMDIDVFGGRCEKNTDLAESSSPPTKRRKSDNSCSDDF